MTTRALVIGCGGTTGGAWILAGGVAVDDLVAMRQGIADDPQLRSHHADAPGRRLHRGPLLARPSCRPDGRFRHRFRRTDRVRSTWRSRRVTGTALQASWSVPVWMPPVTAYGRTYLDGGVASTASLGLLADDGFDEIDLIAPMASSDRARIPGLGGFLEDRCLRRPRTGLITICPGAEDLEDLPPNFMRCGLHHQAFTHSMRTAHKTVAAASVHHELRDLVRAGLTPVQALRAATSTPARRFALTDRGRIAEGLRADLLLVDGDPAVTISDTLNARAVWRRGTRLDSATAPSSPDHRPGV